MLTSLQTKSDKLAALKAQLRFRKDILKQDTGDSNAFSFSKVVSGKRVQLTVEELSDSVKALVHHAYTVVDRTQSPENQIIVGKRVKHKMNKEGTDTWYYGKVISQVFMEDQGSATKNKVASPKPFKAGEIP